MRRFFRFTLLAFSWLFLAAIVVQVYFAGLMLFGQESGRELHQNTGYILGTAGVLFVLLPALARAGTTAIILGVVLAVAAFFQPNLTLLDTPLIAAFHPVNALLIVGMSVFLIRRATELVRQDRPVAVTDAAKA